MVTFDGVVKAIVVMVLGLMALLLLLSFLAIREGKNAAVRHHRQIDKIQQQLDMRRL